MKDLAVLVGEWGLEVTVDGTVMSGGWSRFEWFDDGAFLLQRADAELTDDMPAEWVANSPMPTVSVIGLDDSAGRFTMLYADARGVSRVYAATLVGDVWSIWREAPGFHQRFIGMIEDDGNRITGRWDFSENGIDWRKDFDLTYRRAES